MDYWFRSRNYLIVRYTLGRNIVSIDTFIAEIENRKKNDLADLDKKLNDKKEEEISSKEKDEKEALEKKLTEVKQQKEKHLKQFANDEKLVSELVDLAMLSQNMLKGEHLDAFIKRSVSLLK